MQPYMQSLENLLKQYHVTKEYGLGEMQVQENRSLFGLNKIKKAVAKSILQIFFSQFNSPLVFFIFGSAVIIFFTGGTYDAFIIGGILFLNAFFGTVQDIRLGMLAHQLYEIEYGTVLVIRDKKKVIIPEQELVPGDIMIVQSGEKVCADARILESIGCMANESLLTGESAFIEKKVVTFKDEQPLSKQSNMLFAGSHIVTGYAVALVLATGMNSYWGSLHKYIKPTEIEIPFKDDLTMLLNFIMIAIVSICALFLCIGFLTGKPFAQLLAALTALFVCVVPQGLPVIMTLALVMGIYQVGKHHIIIKKLSLLETLGRMSLLIFDKTGTITDNQISLVGITTQKDHYELSTMQDKKEALQVVGVASVLLNHSYRDHKELKGDMYQAALYAWAHTFGFDEEAIKSEYAIIEEVPFTSQAPVHTCIVKKGKEKITFSLGALNKIEKMGGMLSPLQKEHAALYTESGRRVVALSSHRGSETPLIEALIAFQDTLRPSMIETIALLKKSSIEVVMATGDNERTAQAVAQVVGISTVHAHCSPEEKAALVDSYKHKGHVVGMIGDGVNDLQALTNAHVGITFADTGAALTKFCADVIVAQDAFNELPYAIAYGRHVFYSFKRVILFFFTTNFSEILIFSIAFIGNFPLPLLASHVLWLNLISDGFLDSALALEPKHETTRTVLKSKEKLALIDRYLILRILYQAFIVGSVSFYFFTCYYKTDMLLARTMTMASMTTLQWFMALHCRSLYSSLFSMPLYNNKWLLLVLIGIPLGLVTLMYTNFGQLIFTIVPLSFNHWKQLLLVGGAVMIIEELRKRASAYFFKVN